VKQMLNHPFCNKTKMLWGWLESLNHGVPADIVTDHQRFGVRIFVLADFMLVPEELIMVSLNTKSADKDTRRSYMGTSNEFTKPAKEDSRNQGFNC